MHQRRFALVVLLIALTLVVLRGGGDSGAAAVAGPPDAGAAPVVAPPARPVPVPATEMLGPPTPSPDMLVRAQSRFEARERAAQKRRRAAARVAEARRLRRSRSVPGALRRAWLVHAISRREYDALRATWWRANRDVQRLTGIRRAELGSVVAMASRLASARLLKPSRLEPVFLTIRRNREFWITRPLPRPGERLTFRGDPVVFEYYSGRGLAIQPLASFGKANALAGSCLRLAKHFPCRPAALRRLLERMLALGTERGGFLAWEYLIDFGSGAPPWISGMTQATGAQALARGRRALGDARFGRAAKRALGAFDRPTPLGVAVANGQGRRYTMYSFAPRLRIYNGELQALIGLHDVARISGSRRAQALYARGEPVARRSVAALDTGAWSIYSEGGAESSLNYHRLVGTFLQGMCTRTGVRTYCAAGKRFARYIGEPPRVRVTRATGREPFTRRRTAITFTLSKVSHVMVEVRDRRGRVAMARGMRLTRGRHRIVWVPKRVGRHRLKIVAVGPAGTRAVVQRTVIAKAVPKKKSKKARAAARKRARAEARERAARSSAR
ncbi:MAG TPA: D-glucuronyl C5-epimerase family protein [Solirubrobacteraceae bacterium]|nr:D-glucuronyl C5-epimerase family protein [Solirubrobacteraceae bacterium]